MQLTRHSLFFATILAGSLLSGCLAAPAHEGPTTANFDGKRFHNREPMVKTPSDFLMLGWGAITEAEPWPDWIEVEQQQVPHPRVLQGLSVTFINHASALIQVDGLNILTDPVYSERASPFQWAGPKRVHDPGVRLEDLPPIDVILISHNHYDALDEATLVRLQQRQQQPPLVIAGLGNGGLFEQLGLKRHRDLDWSQSITVAGVEIEFTECRHRSGRGIGDQMKTLWGSFIIKSSAGNIYFAGDTGYGPHFAEAGANHGPFTLSLLPIGAYEPRSFMADVHLNPEEAVQAHLDLNSRASVAMHFGTFQLTYEAIDQPEMDLQSAKQRHGLTDEDFRIIAPGVTLSWPAGKNVPERSIVQLHGPLLRRPGDNRIGIDLQ